MQNRFLKANPLQIIRNTLITNTRTHDRRTEKFIRNSMWYHLYFLIIRTPHTLTFTCMKKQCEIWYGGEGICSVIFCIAWHLKRFITRKQGHAHEAFFFTRWLPRDVIFQRKICDSNCDMWHVMVMMRRGSWGSWWRSWAWCSWSSLWWWSWRWSWSWSWSSLSSWGSLSTYIDR